MIQCIFKAPVSRRLSKNINSFVKNMKRHMPLFLQKKIPQNIAIIFVPPVISKDLNKRYRKKKYTPNILTFRYNADEADIFITPAVVRQQAKRSKEKIEYTLVKLIIHGMIHSSGLHHETYSLKQKKFDLLQQKIITSIGLDPKLEYLGTKIANKRGTDTRGT